MSIQLEEFKDVYGNFIDTYEELMQMLYESGIEHSYLLDQLEDDMRLFEYETGLEERVTEYEKIAREFYE